MKANVRKYRVGDIVKFKRYKEMVNEYGFRDFSENLSLTIDCQAGFVTNMKSLIGGRYIIDEILPASPFANYTKYHLSFASGPNIGEKVKWAITEDMFRLTESLADRECFSAIKFEDLLEKII